MGSVRRPYHGDRFRRDPPARHGLSRGDAFSRRGSRREGRAAVHCGRSRIPGGARQRPCQYRAGRHARRRRAPGGGTFREVEGRARDFGRRTRIAAWRTAPGRSRCRRGAGAGASGRTERRVHADPIADRWARQLRARAAGQSGVGRQHLADDGRLDRSGVRRVRGRRAHVSQVPGPREGRRAQELARCAQPRARGTRERERLSARRGDGVRRQRARSDDRDDPRTGAAVEQGRHFHARAVRTRSASRQR
jgi:hypothetical protein